MSETRRCSQCTLYADVGAEYVGGWWCADCLRHVRERGHPLPVAPYAARHTAVG